MKLKLEKLHILIDGPDGTGKSTVCELLSSEIGIPVIRMENAKEYFKKGTIEDASRSFNETLAQFRDSSFIVDRGFISSKVYSKVYGRNDDLAYLDSVESVLQPVVFILTATENELLKRRPVDEVIKKEERLKTKHEYEILAYKEGYHLIDTTGLTPKDVVINICELLWTIENS